MPVNSEECPAEYPYDSAKSHINKLNLIYRHQEPQLIPLKATMPPMLGATGIGVSDMKKSVDFYTNVLQLGLQPTQTFDVAAFTETVLAFPKGTKNAGSQIILMQYKDGVIPRN